VGSSKRVLSWSEIDTVLTCQAKHDFRYGDQLAGSSLKEKAVAPLLSGGRAWGAAIAAWHTNSGELDAGLKAIAALDASLEEDADQQREFGVFRQEDFDALRLELLQILHHHVDVVEPIPMDSVTERRLLVPLPSRTGERSSNRYWLVCYVDATEGWDEAGWARSGEARHGEARLGEARRGAPWLDEFKLRGQLSDVRLIANSRQIRWYAWAFWRQFGVKPGGVWVNERLRQAPKPPVILKSGKVSHAVQQTCTPRAYEAACSETGEEPREATLEALRARRWFQRVPVVFRDGELEEAGRELVSAAQQIHALDQGQFLPLRNVKRSTCPSCPYRDICPAPDNELIEALFERRPAKRNREGAAWETSRS
jgi:hypothetical protein